MFKIPLFQYFSSFYIIHFLLSIGISLLVKIKEDKEVRENNYYIIKKINDFLELYANNENEKAIEEALKKQKELKEFVDNYLLNLNIKEIAALVVQTNEQQNIQQMQTNQQAKKLPFNNKRLNVERGM